MINLKRIGIVNFCLLLILLLLCYKWKSLDFILVSLFFLSLDLWSIYFFITKFVPFYKSKKNKVKEGEFGHFLTAIYTSVGKNGFIFLDLILWPFLGGLLIFISISVLIAFVVFVWGFIRFLPTLIADFSYNSIQGAIIFLGVIFFGMFLCLVMLVLLMIVRLLNMPFIGILRFFTLQLVNKHSIKTQNCWFVAYRNWATFSHHSSLTRYLISYIKIYFKYWLFPLKYHYKIDINPFLKKFINSIKPDLHNSMYTFLMYSHNKLKNNNSYAKHTLFLSALFNFDYKENNFLKHLEEIDKHKKMGWQWIKFIIKKILGVVLPILGVIILFVYYCIRTGTPLNEAWKIIDSYLLAKVQVILRNGG